jgi:hypothetical protein
LLGEQLASGSAAGNVVRHSILMDHKARQRRLYVIVRKPIASHNQVLLKVNIFEHVANLL